MAVVLGHHTLRAERAHMQPNGGGAGTAVVKEGDRTIGGGRALLEIGHIEDRGFGLGIGLVAQILLSHVLVVAAALPGRRVVPALGMYHERASDRAIVDRLPFDIDHTPSVIELSGEKTEPPCRGPRTSSPTPWTSVSGAVLGGASALATLNVSIAAAARSRAFFNATSPFSTTLSPLGFSVA